MKQYINSLRKIIEEGEVKGDRTNTGTLNIFGNEMRFNLQDGFPLATHKYVNIKHVIGEMLWFLKGETNTNSLNSKIWDSWATEEGDIGPMYGEILRKNPCMTPEGLKQIDQVQNVIDQINNNPNSRRHIMTTLNLGFAPDESKSPQENVKNGRQALQVCHGLVVQFYVHTDGRLDVIMYQRSADYPIGVPYNIAGYAFLLKIIAQQTNTIANELIIYTADSHIYANQIPQVEEILNRPTHKLPQLIFKCLKKFDEYNIEDFELIDYKHSGKIKIPVAI